MQMDFLQAHVPFPKSSLIYNKAIFSFGTNQIHMIDHIGMHKQTREMLYSTLTNTIMTTSKLQTSICNIKPQLKLQNISSLVKDTKIKTLKDLVIKMGYDTSDVKVVEEHIRKKNADIIPFKKQLKLPSTEDPQARSWEKLNHRRTTCLK